MLIIRHEQMRASSPAQLAMLATQPCTPVRATCRHAVANWNEQTLLQRVKALPRRAEPQGITTTRDLETFATLMLLIAPELGHDRDIQALLTDTVIDEFS